LIIETSTMLSTNFILPGRRATTNTYAKSCLAKAFASSKSPFCNPRNVEYPWYGLWCQILMDLTSDRLRLLTIPQHLLYYTEPIDATSDISGEDDPKSDPDVTVSSIPSATSTTPLPGANEIIPDFAIIHIKFRWLDSNGEKVWRNVKIQRAGVPVIAEIKRAGSRSSTTLETVLWNLTFTQTDALIQAAYLFRMIPDQKSVILLVCTSHWWYCRIVTRDQVQGLTKSDGDDFFLQEDDDMEVGDVGNDGAGIELNDENLQQLLKEESDAHMWPMDPADEGTARLLEPIHDEENLHIPCSKWSGAMRLESQVSHQMLFLIHY